MHPDGSFDGEEVMRNYAAMGYSEPAIKLALRNAATLRWLNALDERPTVRDLVQREYAAWSNLPHDEVIGAMAYVTDQESLTWLYSRYAEDIGAVEDKGL